MSRYLLHHEADDCIGCRACEIQCKASKALGPGPSPCQVVTVHTTPRTQFVFMPCFHCEDAWCLAACPTRAMQRRERDGIVFVEPSLCIGCRRCMAACPFGAPQWDPVSRKVVKCDSCMDRLDVGLKPACVTTCVTGCLSFGEAGEMQRRRRERAAAAFGGSDPLR